eukprot:COSAG04_NODE_4_length_52282_cov_12.667133_59_plen_346_part_00
MHDPLRAMGPRALLLLLACGVALTAKPTRPKSVTATCTNSSGDCTLELQAALDTGAEMVRIPHIGRPWILSMAGNPGGAALRARAGGYHGAAISLRSHQQVVLESGVVLQAARGSFHGEQDSLLMGASVENVENVSIIGEPPLGATLQMWLLDYANKSLYTEGTCSGRGACRMGVSLMNVSGLEMRRLTISRSGGDGVFVRGVWAVGAAVGAPADPTDPAAQRKGWRWMIRHVFYRSCPPAPPPPRPAPPRPCPSAPIDAGEGRQRTSCKVPHHRCGSLLLLRGRAGAAALPLCAAARLPARLPSHRARSRARAPAQQPNFAEVQREVGAQHISPWASPPPPLLT